MTDEWKITEHTVNVAAQFADRWATAVAAQARRIQHPANTLERIPDTWMQVMTLRQLLRAVEMAKTATPQDDSRTQRIEQAILEFLDTVVVKASDAGKASGFKLARDALEHFDEYYRGTGPFSSRASSGVTAALTRPSPRTTGSIWKVPQTVRCRDVAECNCTRGIVAGRLA